MTYFISLFPLQTPNPSAKDGTGLKDFRIYRPEEEIHLLRFYRILNCFINSMFIYRLLFHNCCMHNNENIALHNYPIL